MHLYLIRHAEAVNLGDNGVHSDEQRPLTDKGRAQCYPMAATFRRLNVPLELLLVSPLVRTMQTAEGLCANWGNSSPRLEQCDLLAPGGKKRALLSFLLQYQAEHLGLVGHNPDLSELTGWFLGDKRIGINLEKAGMACVEFDGVPGKGLGTLVWLINPTWSQLLTE